MTSSTALANEGLFELTRRPSLTRAVSLSFAETTEEPGFSLVKSQNFVWICFNFSFFTWLRPGSSVVSADDNDSLARAIEAVMSKEKDETWFKFCSKLGDSIWKKDSDHTCLRPVREGQVQDVPDAGSDAQGRHETDKCNVCSNQNCQMTGDAIKTALCTLVMQTGVTQH